MKTLEELKQKRSQFGSGEVIAPLKTAPDEKEKRRLWRECDRIYRAIWPGIKVIAEHVDKINALMPVPLDLDVSETFARQYGDLRIEIDTEWLAEIPDLEKFKRLVAEMRDLCMAELNAQLGKLRAAG